MKFLTSGEKIKETRKYLKMKQQDLQDNELSRGLISMIEIGQRTLSKDVATKIINKFYEKSKELDIKLELNVEYFLRSPSEDAELYSLRKLENEPSLNNIQDILSMSTKFKLQHIKAMAFCKLADYYFDAKDYQNAFENYNNSINIYKDINENTTLGYLYWRIGLCKAITFNYTEAILYFKFSQQYALINKDRTIQKSSLYDIAKSYKKLNKIDLALEYIDMYLSICEKENDFNYYIYANILKANCYEIHKKIDTVIDIYNSILNEFSNNENPLLGYVYNNLGLAYLHKCNFDESKKHFEMAEKIRSTLDKSTLSQTLIEKSNLFFKQGLYRDAINSIELGLINAKRYKNFEDLLKGNYMLIHIYTVLNDKENLKRTYLTIIDLLKEINNIPELISVYNQLSLIYLEENNILEAKEILLSSVKLSGNNFKNSIL